MSYIECKNWCSNSRATWCRTHAEVQCIYAGRSKPLCVLHLSTLINITSSLRDRVHRKACTLGFAFIHNLFRLKSPSTSQLALIYQTPPPGYFSLTRHTIDIPLIRTVIPYLVPVHHWLYMSYHRIARFVSVSRDLDQIQASKTGCQITTAYIVSSWLRHPVHCKNRSQETVMMSAIWICSSRNTTHCLKREASLERQPPWCWRSYNWFI